MVMVILKIINELLAESNPQAVLFWKSIFKKKNVRGVFHLKKIDATFLTVMHHKKAIGGEKKRREKKKKRSILNE